MIVFYSSAKVKSSESLSNSTQNLRQRSKEGTPRRSTSVRKDSIEKVDQKPPAQQQQKQYQEEKVETGKVV